MDEQFVSKWSLCWDCRRATGFCAWSARLKPVKGWTAEKVKVGTPLETYMVQECPLFERDAILGGQRKYKE